MASKNDETFQEGSGQIPEKGKRVGKSWAEEHGGLIFLMIAVSVISFVILYDACMY